MLLSEGQYTVVDVDQVDFSLYVWVSGGASDTFIKITSDIYLKSGPVHLKEQFILSISLPNLYYFRPLI